ncbi:acetyl-CoA C-acyltransferase [Amycolatopsis balhimycina DSM 5908]|uniref:Acetyl-CoA C-acyltransferase n=1 Tax=Amycolatopsis balhimycina DSM 5908 TaxID=1081091 RepID=A0A428WVM5_AMYBA|nr:acetyl-CoA C-acyltransferase [Amycolatopsis balhimycina]RSM47077.1 acetyl-CoA C-acyltransferase [Amycolatopsis balhimycina DSM 5908]
MTEVVIVEAVRSAVGKRRGTLSGYRAPELLGDVLAALFDRTGLDPALVGQVVGGCVGQVGQQGGNVARNAWLGAGLPLEVPASTVTVQCGSAQQAHTLAHGLVAGGLSDIAVACGVESMSQVPMGSSTIAALGDSRGGRYTEHWEATTQFEAAERIAERWELDRGELDAFATLSQHRAAQAVAEGRFRSQIVPVKVTGEQGLTTFDTDECPRPTSLEVLGTLKPNLPDRTPARHTAGSSSQIADGASAVLMMTAERAEQLGLRPRARIVDSVLVGSDPELMLTGPIPATRKLLMRTGLTLDDLDLVEINEAFASVVLAWQRDTGVDLDRVNPNGGAIALGHPLGGTGGILITKALHELERTGGRRALVTMCCGGGLGTGTLIERLG